MGCTPLPLNLISFAGKNKVSYNLLEWRTAAAGAAGDNYFVIEKSIDAQNFTAIGTVNTVSGYAYSFIDQHPADGINYYRLAQRGSDNSLNYSAIITISNRQTGNLSINIYPNPGKGPVWITSSAMVDELKISNLAGQIIYQVRPGKKTLHFQLTEAGTYFIQIFTADQRITQKIIVYK
jgi:hypothetical protein